MCGFLVRQQYLLINPAHGPARLGSHERAGAATDLTLTRTQWRFVPQTVSQRDPTPADQLDHFALLLAYATGRAARNW
jgi:hypothetical protein